MILLPQRLFRQPGVQVILRDGNNCIIEKRLTEKVLRRSGYVSNHVVSVILNGTQQIESFDGAAIRAKAGEMLLIPRGLYYVTDLLPDDGAFHSLLFYFDDSTIQSFLAQVTNQQVDYPNTIGDYLKFEQTKGIRHFVNALLEVYGNSKKFPKALLELKTLELLHLLNISSGQPSMVDFLFHLTLPKKRNIRAFMAHNFDKPLKVTDYARLTGRSMSTFRRDFKAHFNETPQQWLKQRRIEKAIQLIKEQERSVTALAYEVGYENISYFIKAFKGEVGLSPKQYLLKHYRNQVAS